MLNLQRKIWRSFNLNNFSKIHSSASAFYNEKGNVSSLFKPISVVQSNNDNGNVGAELVGKLDKNEVAKQINKFTQLPEIKNLCIENGLDCKYFFKYSYYV